MSISYWTYIINLNSCRKALGLNMGKLVIVGALNVDLISQTNKIPRMGETVTGSSFQTSYGGKAANQAYASAKLGGTVQLLGHVGDDLFGKEVLENLSSVGVDCSLVNICKGQKTGTATILVCQGDNCIVFTPGANATVSIEYIQNLTAVLDQADLISLQLEIPLETVIYICKYAYQRNIPVMLNPSPAIVLPSELYPLPEYVVVNETECEFYTGKIISTIEDAMDGIQEMKKLGCKHLIITLGDKGVVYEHQGQFFHEPARKVQAVDSTAAGDTFTSALATRLLAGDDLQPAVRFAVAASSIVVTRMGAQSSIPSLSEVLEVL